MAQTVSRTGAALSERQSEILTLIALGKSNKEIAHQLGLSTGTVKQHVYVLFRKLGVKNRTMAVMRSASAAAAARDGAPVMPAAQALPELPAELHYARRLVTAVVVEPRPDAIRSSRDAADMERRIVALRARVERLAQAFDASAEPLPGGGIAAWFGRPAAHGDDVERAIAFVRRIDAGEHAGIACAAGIGTVAELVGEGAKGLIAHRTFRVATLLASLAEPGTPLACELTARLANLPVQVAPGGEAGRVLPAGATVIGRKPPPSLHAARQWGGLPFVQELVANGRRGRSQWLGIESWPPQAGTRLIEAIGECLAAHGMPVHSLWMPLPFSTGSVADRVICQLRDGSDSMVASRSPSDLMQELEALAAAGPAVLLAYGMDALPILRAELGGSGIERLRARPLVVVAGAMHRTGTPQTVVRMLGSHPGTAPFVRVLRMRVPVERIGSPDGIRPDVQAVLDAVSSEARAIARLASNPQVSEVTALARALGIAPAVVLERCRELEAWGLVLVNGGRLQFRDEATAAAVRASLA